MSGKIYNSIFLLITTKNSVKKKILQSLEDNEKCTKADRLSKAGEANIWKLTKINNT